MSRRCVRSLLLCALLPLGSAAATPPGRPPSGFTPGEVLVKYREPAAALPLGVSAAPVPGAAHWQRVALPRGQDVEAALAQLAADPAVAAAQPNYVYRADALPDDPEFSQQWALENTGQSVSGASVPPLRGVSGGDIGMREAWDRGKDCRDVVVAVLDTGVNYTHADLQNNLWDSPDPALAHHGWDAVMHDDDPMPDGGDEIHGTHVAGIIGAEGDNGIGTAGVCWHARLMPVRVLDQNGSGSTAGLVEGIRFAVDHGARVLNMSLGRRGPADPMLAEAIAYAGEHGALVVTTAGNGGGDAVGDDIDALAQGASPAESTYPCAFDAPNLLCVTALDQTFSLARYADFGAQSVDLAAPGSNIFAPRPGPVLQDDLSTWQSSGGWAADRCALTAGTFDLLASPVDWCAGGLYSAGTWRVYKRFELPGLRTAQLHYRAEVDAAGSDRFSTRIDRAGGDPFDGRQDREIAAQTGTTYGAYSYALGDCTAAGCTIGFELAGETGGGHGSAVYDLRLNTVQLNSRSYQTLSGTSMAAPHVSGVAALLWALNPDYSLADVVNALRASGPALPSLAGVTSTGRALNAAAALRYIAPPQGLAAQVR